MGRSIIGIEIFFGRPNRAPSMPSVTRASAEQFDDTKADDGDNNQNYEHVPDDKSDVPRSGYVQNWLSPSVPLAL
jgi:hypothetical protein